MPKQLSSITDYRSALRAHETRGYTYCSFGMTSCRRFSSRGPVFPNSQAFWTSSLARKRSFAAGNTFSYSIQFPTDESERASSILII